MNHFWKLRSFTKAAITRTLDFQFNHMPFRLENVSNSKLKTLLLAEANRARPRPGKPWYPVHLHIEPSSKCSLRCPLCPSGMGALKGSRHLMSMETFRSLMDEVGGHAVVAVMWMWGEPFMNPNLPEMISYAHSKNLATLTSTNGQHIQTREEAECLVASGLDGIIVAVDGATQETYSRYRVGGDLQRVFRCLELLRQAKDDLGSSTPVVNVRTVVNKENESELDAIAAIAQRFGADLVAKKSIYIMDRSGADADAGFAPRNPHNTLMRFDNGQRVRKSIDALRCLRPWRRMSVNAEGVVLPCAFDFDKTQAFGQGGNGMSFLDAWWSEKATDFRRRFTRAKSVFPFCLDCAYRDSGTCECTLETRHVGSPA